MIAVTCDGKPGRAPPRIYGRPLYFTPATARLGGEEQSHEARVDRKQLVVPQKWEPMEIRKVVHVPALA